MPETLVINEIYMSLQGESTFAGLPCVFVRLTACNLRCSYCDTAYAFTEGKKLTVKEARAEVHRLAEICSLLFSWVHPLSPEQQDKSLKPVPAGQTPISRKQLAEKIIADALPVRFQIQMHKIIWPPEQRGV